METHKQTLQDRGKIRKVIFFILGSLALVLGIVGIILPVLPTTPFILVAAACYLRSFDGLHNKLINSTLYTKHLSYMIEKKGMKLNTKLAILIPVLCILIAVFLFIDSTFLRVVIIIMATAKIIVFSRIKTISKSVEGESCNGNYNSRKQGKI